MIAGTMGFDKKPQLYKAELCYEEGGAFYFAAAKCETYYGEISVYPELVLCTYDPETETLLRLRQEPVFSPHAETARGVCLSGKTLSVCVSIRGFTGTKQIGPAV